MSTLSSIRTKASYGLTILVATLSSIAVMIIGYSRIARFEYKNRQRQLIADAYRSVIEYREFACKARHRLPGKDSNTITGTLSEMQTQLNLHIATLEIEVPRVADHYKKLVTATKRIVDLQITTDRDQVPPDTGNTPQVHDVDLSELETADAVFINAARKYLPHRIRVFQGRNPRSRKHRNAKATTIPTGVQSTLRQSNSQADLRTLRTGIEHSNKPTSDPVGENTSDDSSDWQFILSLFGKSGIAVPVIAFIFGILCSLMNLEYLIEVLSDLITPAAALIGIFVAIFAWVSDPRFLSQSSEGTTKRRELLGIVSVSSLSAILGISSVVLLKLSSLDDSVSPLVDTCKLFLSDDSASLFVDNFVAFVAGIRTALGGFASLCMGLVLVGLTRLIFSALKFVLHQREQTQSVDAR